MNPKHSSSTRSELAAIIGCWILLVVGLCSLQQLGFPVGFHVWPMGEDRNWISFLQQGEGTEAARLFWRMNDRNPLSPWWYIAFRSAILRWDDGLLLLHYTINLGLAIALYLCIRGVTGRSGRSYALSMACIAAVMSFNAYIDNVTWDFTGALALTLLSIWAYTRFLNSRCRLMSWYGASLVLWFFAYATYTLQSGAVLAIAYLSFAGSAEVSRMGPSTLYWRAMRTALHIWPYLALYAGFLLVWRTTSNPNMAPYYTTQFSAEQFLSSVRSGLWHDAYWRFLAWFGGPLGLRARLLVFGVMFAVAFLLLTVVGAGSRSKSDVLQFPIRARALLDAVMVAVCVAVPTILVEASSTVWVPGSRWLMLHQFWLPFVAASLLTLPFVVMSAARDWRGSGQSRMSGTVPVFVWRSALAAVIASTFMIDLGHNQEQVSITHRERALRDAMAKIIDHDAAAGRSGPESFLVRVELDRPWITDALSQTYASTWFPGKNVTLRIIQSEPAVAGWAAWWTVVFDPDDVGVENYQIGGGVAPYSQVHVLALDDADKVSSLAGAGKDAFAGRQVEWHRNEPLPAEEEPLDGAPAVCGGTWASNDTRDTAGFSVPEKDAVGPFRWMIVKSAEMVFPGCPGPADITVKVASAVTPENISQLSVEFAGKPVRLTMTSDSLGTIMRGHLDDTGLASHQPAQLRLTVPKLDQIEGATREFGVAVRSATVRLTGAAK